jgi:flagellar basal body-associated protein FliL
MKLPVGRKAILLIGLPLGLAAGGAFMYMQMSASGPTAPPKIPDPSPGQHGIMLKLEERVVNLQAGGSYHYAKIGVTIELRPADASFYALAGEAKVKGEEAALVEYEGDVPVLLDILGSVVGGKSSDDLSKPDGRTKLKEELLTALRDDLGSEKVLDLYFTDLVMQ